jgi:hypothetical protein
MKRRGQEGLVGGIIFIVATVLAVVLSGCDADNAETAWMQRRRAAGFTECEGYCRGTPLEVRFNDSGHLTLCRCDVVLPLDAEVE